MVHIWHEIEGELKRHTVFDFDRFIAIQARRFDFPNQDGVAIYIDGLSKPLETRIPFAIAFQQILEQLDNAPGSKYRGMIRSMR